MVNKIINLKISNNRIIQFLDMPIKLFSSYEDCYHSTNYKYATEEDYNNAVDSEIKLYLLLSQANIQNIEILTETEKDILKKFKDAFEAVDNQYQSFDSTVVLVDEILETVFCRKVSIW